MMTNNFKVTIGIEIHAEINSKSKIFSDTLNDVNSLPNTNINEYDICLPGAMPQVNIMCVKKAIAFAKALNMQIDPILRFDRKHYFYQDLPKGFQITQQYYPIAKNGKIILNSGKEINIEKFHLEEDTAKQFTQDGEIFLDYNRSGVGLIEIVSRPDMSSASEAIEYLTQIKRNLVFLDICDGKMEDGSLRVDLNISLSDSNILGTKVEIKNINSFSNTAKAIDYEINRQLQILTKNEKVAQETRRWDSKTETTIFMREKINAIDYHYFPEPNILPIDINFLIDELNSSIIRTPTIIKTDLISDGVSTDFVELLLDNYKLYQLFMLINSKVNNTKLVSTWLLVETIGKFKSDKKTIDDILENNVYIENLITLISLLSNNKINTKQAKIIIDEMYVTNKNPNEIIVDKQLTQNNDTSFIVEKINNLLTNNPNLITDYKSKPDRVKGFIVGQILKETKGQTNPSIVSSLLQEILKQY